MHNTHTFETILKRMLDRVSNKVDKREGSVIYASLAPIAAELAQMYAELDVEYNLLFADTATGEYLTRITSEFGVNRMTATKARRKGQFYDSSNNPFNVPIGNRFSIQNLTYVVVEYISPGTYSMECETAGAIGNQLFGQMLPIEFIQGLARAELLEVLIPGEDEETDEALRQRYYEIVNEPAFGGNISDYKQKINSIDGVGGTKVFPTWQGGGTVKCTIIGSDYGSPSTTLVDEVQTTIDPTINSGEGIGFAPIGHSVTITGVTEGPINIETTVTLEAGISVGQVQEAIKDIIEAYFLELRQDWANQSQIVVRIAQIDSRILSVSGIEDVANTQLNGLDLNITLGAEEIPILGTVLVNE